MVNPVNASEAFRQGEQAAQMRIMNSSLLRLQDRVHELEAAIRTMEDRGSSDRHQILQDVWTKIEELKQELHTVQSDIAQRIGLLMSDLDMLEFTRAHFNPLKDKVERMEEFRLKALGVILAIATMLGAMSSYLMDAVFKRGG